MSDNGQHDDEALREIIDAAREAGLDVAEMLEEMPYDPATTSTAIEADHLCEMADARLPDLEPDDDLVPMTVMSGERGVVPLVHPFADDIDKQAVMEGVVPQLAAAVGLRAFGQITTAWMYPADEEDADVRPADHPRRREVVAITACDGLTAQMRIREIARRPGKPPAWKHAAWEVQQMDPQEIGGPLLDSLLFALFAHRISRAARIILWSRPLEWWTEERLAALRRVGYQIMEGGTGPRGRRDMAEMRDEAEMIEDQVLLGSLVRDDEGLRVNPELTAMSERADLWEIDVDDGLANTKIPGGIPW